MSIDNIITGEEFEEYCAELLRQNGYINVQKTPASGDHGVDLLAEKDFISYAIQCKYYSSPVGNSAIQEVYSGKEIYSRDIAVVMTNNTFTNQAVYEAGQLGVKLWDGTVISQMIKEDVSNNVTISKSTIERMDTDSAYEFLARKGREEAEKKRQESMKTPNSSDKKAVSKLKKLETSVGATFSREILKKLFKS